MNTNLHPSDYFKQGYEAAERGEPVESCQLLFDAWPRQAWMQGHKLYLALKDADELLVRVDKTPKVQGETAYKLGRSIYDNPYGPDSQDWRNWRLGWYGEANSVLRQTMKRHNGIGFYAALIVGIAATCLVMAGAIAAIRAVIPNVYN